MNLRLSKLIHKGVGTARIRAVLATSVGTASARDGRNAALIAGAALGIAGGEGKLDESSSQRRLLVTIPRHLALLRATLSERTSGQALGDLHRAHAVLDTGRLRAADCPKSVA